MSVFQSISILDDEYMLYQQIIQKYQIILQVLKIWPPFQTWLQFW